MRKFIAFVISVALVVATLFGVVYFLDKEEPIEELPPAGELPVPNPNPDFDDEDFETGEFDDDFFTPLSSGLTLNESLSESTGTVRYLLDGAYTLATVAGDKTELGGAGAEEIILKGGANGATINAIGENIKSVIQAVDGATLHFQNITFLDETGGGTDWHDWALEFGGKLVFENCIFPTEILLKDDASATFLSCAFHSAIKGRYSVWIWDGSASFEGCTFTGFRGMKIHEEGSDVVNVSINKCLFKEISEKPGIAIGSINMNPKETTVSVKDSRFIDCYAWDEIGSLDGVDGFYEIDTPKEDFNFITADNFVSCPTWTYSITYKAVEAGVVGEIHPLLFKANGNYPTEYRSVMGATVDELKEIVYPTRNEDIMFFGWYYDEACTLPFNGIIAPRTKGNITLYARISKAYWTDPVKTECDLNGHDVVEVCAVLPTCESAGNTAGTCCSVCGEYFSGQVYIPALGHKKYFIEAIPATCTEDGRTAGEGCKTCGKVFIQSKVIPATGHTEVIDEAVPADCEADGLTAGSHCSKCGEILAAQEVVPATGHSYGVATVQATCTKPGSNTYTCQNCGDTYKESLAVLGHTVVVDEAIPATCEVAGKTEGAHCSTCNTVLIMQETIYATGHKEVVDEAVSATCENYGLTSGSHCSTCGKVFKAQEIIPATGHTVVFDKAVSATCESDGKTAGTHCSICGEVLAAQEVIPATGHTEVIDEAVSATCESDGRTAGSHCSTCKETLSGRELIPATGHDWDSGVVAKEATCKEAGTKEYTCHTCGETKTESIPLSNLHVPGDDGKCKWCGTTVVSPY